MEDIKLEWPPVYQAFVSLSQKEQPNSIKDFPARCIDAHRTQEAEQQQIWQRCSLTIASSTPEQFSSVSRDCGTINLKGNLNSAKKRTLVCEKIVYIFIWLHSGIRRQNLLRYFSYLSCKKQRLAIRVCSGTSTEDSACEMEDVNSEIHSELGCSLSGKDFKK